MALRLLSGRSLAVPSLFAMDYAGAVSTERGRCFRFVCDQHGKPENCPAPIVAVGMLKVDRWYEVDACAEHAVQLRSRPQAISRQPRPRISGGAESGRR
jgi:hypothetical protein